MKSNRTYILKITTTAVMIALTCVLTLAVRIPSPTKGYLNLGDCAVLFGAWLLGPVLGTVAGGVGSALADILAGYPVYAPGTLVIKALMAATVSLSLYLISGKGKSRPRAGFIAGAVAAETLMVAGYWLYEALVIGEGLVPALAGVPGNAVQGVVGAAGSFFLVEILSHTGVGRICGAGGDGRTVPGAKDV